MSTNGDLATMTREELQREYLRGRLQEAEGKALKMAARSEIDRRYPAKARPAPTKGKKGAAQASHS